MHIELILAKSVLKTLSETIVLRVSNRYHIFLSLNVIKIFPALKELVSVEPNSNIPIICMTYAPFSYNYQA